MVLEEEEGDGQEEEEEEEEVESEPAFQETVISATGT